MSYNEILVPLDGSQLAEGILPLVRKLAGGYTAKVRLHCVVEESEALDVARVTGNRYGDAALTGARTVAQKYVEGVRNRLGVKAVTSVVVVGNVADSIIKEAELHSNTLVAMSTHGRGGLGRALLGSVADKVLHGTKVPVMLYHVKQGETAQRDYTTVVVPLDGSELAEEVLPQAIDLAKALKLKVMLLRAVSIPVMAQAWDMNGGAYYPVELLADLETDAKQYLSTKAAELKKQGVAAVETRVITGAAGYAVVSFVEPTFDTIVAICTHGRSGIGRWVMGSVAQAIVNRAPVPTLIVRPRGKS